MWALHFIQGIQWQDRITILEVLDKANSASIEVMLLKAQLSWAGHIIWMGDEYIPKEVFFGELAQGQRKQGQPQMCYKDTLKNSLKWCGIKPSELSIAAQVLPHSCALTHSKCINGKGATSRTACSPWSSPQSCFCPCHNNGLPVSHLPLTLQIQTGAAEPFQSILTGAQTKSSMNPRDNYHSKEVPLPDMPLHLLILY